MRVSVVIPTCNRKSRLLSLLGNLKHSTYPIHEVIIVDSGEDRLSEKERFSFHNLNLRYMQTKKSVCLQRNTGIQKATSEWIFLCDDDIEIGRDYLEHLINHIISNPEAGAVSGLWLQNENGQWTANYPEYSVMRLIWKSIFRLSIWGEINCSANNLLARRIKQYYKRKGNHISKAGWPVITDFSGEYFIAPVYSLGASLIRKEWLIMSPFDEALDQHGIGDNYGVLIGFPCKGVHVLNHALVYHHHENINRLKKSLQYYHRALSLDYFISTNKNLKGVKKRFLLWSLTGNLFDFIISGKRKMIKPAIKSIWTIVTRSNPYLKTPR